MCLFKMLGVAPIAVLRSGINHRALKGVRTGSILSVLLLFSVAALLSAVPSSTNMLSFSCKVTPCFATPACACACT